MTNRNNSINVPEAKEAMEKFKMEAASDQGVFSPLKLPDAASSSRSCF